MKKTALFLTIAMILFARDDPFELKMTPKKSPQSVEGAISKPLGEIKITLPTTTRILKEVRFVYQKLDGSIGTETILINSDIDWHYPISISQIANQHEEEMKKPISYKIEDFNFMIQEKKIFIETLHKVEQVFVLPKPFRIVLDFNREQKVINHTISPKGLFFRSINVGTHQNFYRVTLELDGQYGYDLQQNEKGYIVTLK